MEIELTCLKLVGLPGNFFQIVEGNVVVLNEKNNVIEIGVQAAIQLAEGNAVGIGDEDFQVAKLANTETAFRVAFG